MSRQKRNVEALKMGTKIGIWIKFSLEKPQKQQINNNKWDLFSIKRTKYDKKKISYDTIDDEKKKTQNQTEKINCFPITVCQ